VVGVAVPPTEAGLIVTDVVVELAEEQGLFVTIAR